MGFLKPVIENQNSCLSRTSHWKYIQMEGFGDLSLREWSKKCRKMSTSRYNEFNFSIELKSCPSLKENERHPFHPYWLFGKHTRHSQERKHRESYWRRGSSWRRESYWHTESSWNSQRNSHRQEKTSIASAFLPHTCKDTSRLFSLLLTDFSFDLRALWPDEHLKLFYSFYATQSPKKSKIASPVACNMWDRISPKLTLANTDVKGVVRDMSKPKKCQCWWIPNYDSLLVLRKWKISVLKL